MALINLEACLSDLGEFLCSCSEELTIFSAFFLIIDEGKQRTAVALGRGLHCTSCIVLANYQAAYMKLV